MRFQNRTATPLILGYVQGSGIVTDDRGNRYTVNGPGAIRGIGEISNNTFDSQVHAPARRGQRRAYRVPVDARNGARSSARPTMSSWRCGRSMQLEANQYQLGKEYALKLDGFTAGASVASAQPASGPVAPSTGAGAGTTGGSVAAVPAEVPDACAGKPRCYGAGPFVAEVTQVTTSKVTYYVYRPPQREGANVTAQPLVLGWQNGSGIVIDDVGNRYAAKSVKGIGLVTCQCCRSPVCAQPGPVTSIHHRLRRSVPAGPCWALRWTADFVLQQLEILPSRQVRSVPEYSVSSPGPVGRQRRDAAGSTNAVDDGAAPATSASDSTAANAVNATAGR